MLAIAALAAADPGRGKGHGWRVAPRLCHRRAGLHHAQRDHASGFCLLNDPALAIQAALDGGVERVVYVDIDVHHGDGVQALFYADPRVLTISLHQSGRTLYPGTGFVDEQGTGEARGTSVNIAFPPQTGDDVFLDTIERVVVPLTTAFAPDLLVTQNGCDMHIEDPLANLLVTLEGYATAVRRLHRLAHDVCEGRLVALGGGGPRHRHRGALRLERALRRPGGRPAAGAARRAGTASDARPARPDPRHRGQADRAPAARRLPIDGAPTA